MRSPRCEYTRSIIAVDRWPTSSATTATLSPTDKQPVINACRSACGTAPTPTNPARARSRRIAHDTALRDHGRLRAVGQCAGWACGRPGEGGFLTGFLTFSRFFSCSLLTTANTCSILNTDAANGTARDEHGRDRDDHERDPNDHPARAPHARRL